jgi:hypothetical protein
MKNLAKPSLGFFRQTSTKKFLFAVLMIAALSGAVLVTHSSPGAASRPCFMGGEYICWE